MPEPDVSMRIQKLAVFDLDKTLLDDRSLISDETAARLRAVSLPGLACTIASGRDFEHIAPYIEQLAWLSVPVIAEQGALVVDPQSGHILMERAISSEVLLGSVEAVRSMQSPMNMILYGRSEPQVFRNAGAPSFVDGWRSSSYAGRLLYLPAASEIATDGVRKISIICQPGDTDTIRQLIADSLGPRASVVKADTSFLNIMDAGVSKGVALRWLIEYLGVESSHVMAVGDCEADRSMFAVAGIPVAVANADEQTRSLVRFVVPSNNEEGAAMALESFAAGAFGV
jgi:Cof subfamily protein (haloacid dehalogenase superfamily)